MRFMATCPEATEATCDFIRILDSSDYNKEPQTMRKMANDALAHGKSVLIRNYRSANEGVKFDMASLEEDLHVCPQTLIDVQGR